MKRIVILAALTCAAFISVGMQGGCTRSTPVPNPTTPPSVVAVPRTALEWTIFANASVARANRGLDEAVQQLAKSGTLTAAQARPVIVACGKIAKASESIRGITSVGTEASWAVDAPQIQTFIADIKVALPAKTTSNPTVNIAIDLVGATVTILLNYAR